ncbi:MAG: hypothetical protein JW869_03080 [Candidatus Omnitrophica bacterium]|nr:hypothetical protein [Candidatus Omnitrophota bacterium]
MMNMTPVRLLLFRIYNITLGRFAFFDKLLNKALVGIFIRQKKDDEFYCQSSSYFLYSEIENRPKG